MALVEKRFKAADTDHDGKIDATELKTPAGQSLQKLLY
jgi:Ca2+-binding EF-hand superfamily protein